MIGFLGFGFGFGWFWGLVQGRYILFYPMSVTYSSLSIPAIPAIRMFLTLLHMTDRLSDVIVATLARH